MTLQDLVKDIKTREAERLGGLTPAAVATVLKTAFLILRESIDTAEPGSLKVAALGRFDTREVEGQGKHAGRRVRRTHFVPLRLRPLNPPDNGL
jgi:hypothetical protein